MRLLSGGLKLPNTELGGSLIGKLLLYEYVWNRYTIDYWHQVNSGRCNFNLLMPALTVVSLLETYLLFETATPRGDIVNRPSAYRQMV
jgi:hypothetical protein